MGMHLKYGNFSTELQPLCNRKCTALCIITGVRTEHDLKTIPVTFLFFRNFDILAHIQESACRKVFILINSPHYTDP
jgi:hypothetical protein